MSHWGTCCKSVCYTGILNCLWNPDFTFLCSWFLAGTLSTGVIIHDREHAVMIGKSLHKPLKGLFLKRVRDFTVSSSLWLEADFFLLFLPFPLNQNLKNKMKTAGRLWCYFHEIRWEQFHNRISEKKSHIPAGRRKKGGWEVRVTGLHREILNEKGRGE